MLEIGPVLTLQNANRFAILRMRAHFPQHSGRRPAPARVRSLVSNERDGTVQSDFENLVRGWQVCVGFEMLHIRPVASEICENGFAIFRMLANLARKRQQPECFLKIDLCGVPSLRQAGALGLFAVRAFAKLDIRTKPAAPQGDVQSALQVFAKMLAIRINLLTVRLAVDLEGTGELAFRIIGAADESTVTAKLQAQLAVCTTGAGPRVKALGGVFGGAEDVRPK